MKKFAYVFLGIVAFLMVSILMIMAYSYITSKSDGNILSQQTLGFLKSHPSSIQLKRYLKENKINFEVIHNIPAPGSESISSVLAPPNPKKSAYIDFYISGVKKAWCGEYDDYFIVIYDKRGVFLESKSFRRHIGCDP